VRTLILAALLLSSPAFAGTPYPDTPHVVAYGDGEIIVAPDMATVSMTAEYLNADPAVAKQKVDGAINAMLKLVPQFGIGVADITASNLSLDKHSHRDDNDRNVDDGYAASRQIKIKLHDLDRLNALMDAALSAGINTVDDVDFESSHADDLRLQARAKAAVDARAKAADLAKGFDAALGPVYSINSANSNLTQSYGGSDNLDRIVVTGSRFEPPGHYLQPTVTYSERVAVVFELKR